MGVWELERSFECHSKAVRCIVLLNDKLFVSGSYDGTVIVWKVTAGGVDGSSKEAIVPHRELKQHQGFVLCATKSYDEDRHEVIDSDPSFYTGGFDRLIYRVAASGSILRIYSVHSTPVNALAEVEGGSKLLAGSWDGVVRLIDRDTSDVLLELTGHSHAVCFARLTPDASRIATSSSDGVLRLWDGGNQIKTVQAHKEFVRCVKKLEPYGGDAVLATASNDCKVKLWNAEGDNAGSIDAHDAFVYDVMQSSANPELLFSASEDGFMKLWNMLTLENVQVIQCPTALWTLVQLSAHTVAVGSDGGAVHCWTDLASRKADAAQLQDFEKHIKAKREHTQQQAESAPLNISPSSLPQFDHAEMHPGKKEGQIKLFSEGSVVIACEWTGTEWERKGEVTGQSTSPKASASASASSSTMHAAQVYYPGDQLFAPGYYDHVFNVEIEVGGSSGDGKAKLPYNVGQNKLEISEMFCAREGINRVNVDDIVKFLEANAQPAAAASASSAPAPLPTIDGTDPLPCMTYATFGTVTSVNAICQKCIEFNSLVPEECRLTAVENRYLTDIGEHVSKPQWLRVEFRACEIDLVFKKLVKWPTTYFFPVADLWRILVLHSRSTSIHRTPEDGSLCVHTVLKHIDKATAIDFPDTGLASKVVLCCLRYISNMFELPTNRNSIVHHALRVLKTMMVLPRFSERNPRIAVSTIMLNYSIALMPANKHKAERQQVLYWLTSTLPHEDDKETLRRSLIALNNLVAAQDKDENTKLSATISGLSQKIRGMQDDGLTKAINDVEFFL